MTDTKPAYLMPLDPSEAWSRLRSQSFGRLAVSVDGQPDVFPVNFLASESRILIRTGEGAKLEAIAHNKHVAFEADESTDTHAWSVVIKGIASRVDDPADLESAEHAPLWAWAPGTQNAFITIEPTEVTGRFFQRG